MQQLEGYQNPEILYESSNSVVCRAFEEKNKRPVILKVLNKKYPTPEEISKFQQEYELTDRFEKDGVIQVYRLSKIDNSPAIIMEDIEGQSLATILESKKLNLTFQFGKDDFKGSPDTTVSYGLSWRVQDQEEELIGITNGGTAYSVNGYDGKLNRRIKRIARPMLGLKYKPVDI